MKKLGLIVNPIAGMGGRVGLKGSDGVEILRRARELGAEPEAPARAMEALGILASLKDRIELVTYPGEMGEEEGLKVGFSPRVIGAIKSGETAPEDTIRAARSMAFEEEVDLLMFAGGDGTARNIFNAVDTNVPVIGIPAGVKIHSAVYAVTPRAAGQVAAMYLGGDLTDIREAEVMDIDEDAFRRGVVTARLYGYLRVPSERRYVQSVKSGGLVAEKEALLGIARDVIEAMDDPDLFFIIGPGTTTRSLMDELGLENTLLGVDVVRGRKLAANDVSEKQLLDIINDHKVKIVVTAIGGQGHVFGRGNQQISPAVLRKAGKENIIIIAAKNKLASLSGRPLLADTGHEDLNRELSGYARVTTGYHDYVMYKIGY